MSSAEAHSTLSAAAFPVVELLGLLQTRGIPRAEALRDTGIDEAALDSPSAVLPYQAIGRAFVRAIETTHDPALGLALGPRLLGPRLGILGYAARASRDVRAAIDVAIKYRPLYAPHIGLELETRGPDAVLRLSHGLDLGKLEPIVTDTLVSGAIAQLSWLLGRALQPRRVRFARHAPKHALLYGQALGAPIDWDAPATELWFDAALLDEPLKSASDVAAREACEVCDARLQALDAREPVIERILHLLRSKPLAESLTSAARSLRMSERSLRRALRASGTSYRRARDEARHDLALEYLRSTAMPLERIAQQLGFVDARSFRRAFKRWTGGQVPTDLRAARRRLTT